MQIQNRGAALSRELRHGSGVFLRRRRAIAGLTLFSGAVLGVVALYQIGILKKLPQPRSRYFDTKKVHGSAQGYSIAWTPDAFLGLASYGVTAALVAGGGQKRARTQPWLPIGMGLKMLADAVLAGKLTADECWKLRAFSVWSLLTAVATWSALPLAIPEVKTAIRQVRG